MRARRANPWGRLGHPASRPPPPYAVHRSAPGGCLGDGRGSFREVAMETIGWVLVALAASVMMGHAAAADLGGAPRRAVYDEPIAYGPAFSWTGLYIGAHVGYGWSEVDWQFAATP